MGVLAFELLHGCEVCANFDIMTEKATPKHWCSTFSSILPLHLCCVCPPGSIRTTSTILCRVLGHESISILNSSSSDTHYHVYLVSFLVLWASVVRLLLTLCNSASVSFVHSQEVTGTPSKARAARSSSDRLADRLWGCTSEGS